jgi:hypothetical protein
MKFRRGGKFFNARLARLNPAYLNDVPGLPLYGTRST